MLAMNPMGQLATPKFTFFQTGILQLADFHVVARVAYVFACGGRLL